MTVDSLRDSERCNKGVVSRLERIQTRLGFDLVADPNDYLSILLMRDGIFEVPETDIVTRIVRPGDICIDAGCHLGYYSCLLGKLIAPAGCLYAFDANSATCEATNRNLDLNGIKRAEVTHVALGDHQGKVSFYISTDRQTGLSSLGKIQSFKDITAVNMMRLEDFLQARHVERVRLLKLDVEGSEALVLEGLGGYLSQRLVDYILMECYDERLRLLNTSTEQVSATLRQAGYIAWEYDTAAPSGWSRTEQVRSRPDCNYLFSNPENCDDPPLISVTGAVTVGLTQRDDARHLLERTAQELTQVAADKDRLVVALQEMENSAGWRFLNSCRIFRDRLAPKGSGRRRMWDAFLRMWRSDQNSPLGS